MILISEIFEFVDPTAGVVVHIIGRHAGTKISGSSDARSLLQWFWCWIQAKVLDHVLLADVLMD